MAVKTTPSNSMSVSTHLAQRQIGPQGLKNRVSHPIRCFHAPTNSAEEAVIFNRDRRGACSHRLRPACPGPVAARTGEDGLAGTSRMVRDIHTLGSSSGRRGVLYRYDGRTGSGRFVKLAIPFAALQIVLATVYVLPFFR